MKKLIICIVCLICINNLVSGQAKPMNNDLLRESAIKVFIDCYFCDKEYIKREIPFINYVRDRKEAQVHLMITRRGTGSGGQEFKIEFIGLKEFDEDNEVVIYNSRPNNTLDEIREGIANNMKIGIMKYVSKTPLKEFISINYNHSVEDEENIVEDKWKSWVFRINVKGEIRGEESYKGKEIETGFSAEKVTPDWRLEFDGEFKKNINNYKLEDESHYVSKRSNSRFEHVLIKSLGNHWSLGEFINLSSSTYMNNKFSFSVFPAIEYNLFPYKESSRKQLRFIYGVGYEFVNYRDITIYDKMQEGLFKQTFIVALGIKQTWCTIHTSMTASTYLHNFSNNRLNFSGLIYLRIYKGLSFTISGKYDIIHDQLSIPKQDATQEEILLRIRQMESQYNYKVELGLSYTFGAIYNNVVNPRFGK